MDSVVFIFESNDEVSSSEYWAVILVVRCCCGDGLVIQLSIEIILLLSSCGDGEREIVGIVESCGDEYSFFLNY